jgi:hypothetical protein
MRRRLPSPALVIACVALFVALAGAGFAASYVLVKSPSAVTLVPGNVSASGKVTGSRLRGARVSEGVYTLTIIGRTFSPSLTIRGMQSMVTPQVITIVGSNKVLGPSCDTSPPKFTSAGAAIVQVSCFTFDPALGWTPADAAFDVQFTGH